MLYRIFLFSFLFFSFTASPATYTKPVLFPLETAHIASSPISKYEIAFRNLKINNFVHPSQISYINALKGYERLKSQRFSNKKYVTIVDFSLSSTKKRMWVIDIENNSILFHSLVAHGRNSGHEYASSFSNKPESHQSSLGFYATGETYYGKHGYSLRLDGLEKGVNNNARKRAIVIHGASYVSDSFISTNGRLGRSFGCPSLPEEDSKAIIDVIKDKSCLYIHY